MWNVKMDIDGVLFFCWSKFVLRGSGIRLLGGFIGFDGVFVVLVGFIYNFKYGVYGVRLLRFSEFEG